MLKGVRRVIDLGIAPGGWSQVVRRKHPDAVVVGIDLLPVDPIEGVTILQMDFMDDRAPALLTEALGGAPDLVLSDMAANTVRSDERRVGKEWVSCVDLGGGRTISNKKRHMNWNT